MSEADHSVMATFRGGPHDGQTIPFQHTTMCRDTIGMISEAWYAEGKDGAIRIMKGGGFRGAKVPWISYLEYIYNKTGPVKGNKVEYQFERTEEIRRCRKLLASKGRYCGFRALEGSDYCDQHQQ